MTIDDVRTYGRPAYLSLANGVLLRYHPEEGRVRAHGRPRPSEAWDCPAIPTQDVPREGWRHERTCGCSRCRPDGADVG
jgi:hypothetical protein